MRVRLGTREILDLERTIAEALFDGIEYPWQALPLIKTFVLQCGESLPADEYERTAEGIWIHRSARVAASASISGPCIICEGAEIRHCAFIRGSAIVGRGAVVGNSTELKNALLFDAVQVPHYNYVGDSILGYKAHMGAGAITSNVKSDKTLVHVRAEGIDIETGMKKFGAILGDHVEIGCNSVLNPGTVIGRGATVYPLSAVRGCVPEGSIYKTGGVIAERT